MKQSLLAFLAMAVFTLLALTQQRVTLHYHGLVHGREYEIAAMNKITEKLTEIQSKAFDEVDTESTADPAQRTTTTGLTAIPGIEADDTEHDDIDDYDGYQETAGVYTFNGYEYAFDMSISVCYIDEVNPVGTNDEDRCVSAPTLTKQVTITLTETLPTSSAAKTEDEPANTLGRTPVYVKLSRIYSPAALAYH